MVQLSWERKSDFAESLFGFGDARALVAVDADLALLDFVDDHFKVAAAVAFDHGAGALDELNPAVLDEGAQLKAAAEFVHDFVALECFDHLGNSFGFTGGT